MQNIEKVDEFNFLGLTLDSNLNWKKFLKYNLPYIINNTPDIAKEQIYTDSLRGFTIYAKKILLET